MVFFLIVFPSLFFSPFVEIWFEYLPPLGALWVAPPSFIAEGGPVVKVLSNSLLINFELFFSWAEVEPVLFLPPPSRSRYFYPNSWEPCRNSFLQVIQVFACCRDVCRLIFHELCKIQESCIDFDIFLIDFSCITLMRKRFTESISSKYIVLQLNKSLDFIQIEKAKKNGKMLRKSGF